jgi:hypothetical protein
MIDIGGGLCGCCLPAGREAFYEQLACNRGDDEAAPIEGRPRECSRSFRSSDHCIKVVEFTRRRHARQEGLDWCATCSRGISCYQSVCRRSHVLYSMLYTLLALTKSKVHRLVAN